MTSENWSPNVTNFVFIGTGDGYIYTFEWENVTGEAIENPAYNMSDNTTLASIGLDDNDSYSSQSARKKKGIMREIHPYSRELCLHSGEILSSSITYCQNFLVTVSTDGCVVLSGLGRGAEESLKIEENGALNTRDEELTLQDWKVVGEARERVGEIEEVRECRDGKVMIERDEKKESRTSHKTRKTITETDNTRLTEKLLDIIIGVEERTEQKQSRRKLTQSSITKIYEKKTRRHRNSANNRNTLSSQPRTYRTKRISP